MNATLESLRASVLANLAADEAAAARGCWDQADRELRRRWNDALGLCERDGRFMMFPKRVSRYIGNEYLYSIIRVVSGEREGELSDLPNPTTVGIESHPHPANVAKPGERWTFANEYDTTTFEMVGRFVKIDVLTDPDAGEQATLMMEMTV